MKFFEPDDPPLIAISSVLSYETIKFLSKSNFLAAEWLEIEFDQKIFEALSNCRERKKWKGITDLFCEDRRIPLEELRDKAQCLLLLLPE